MLTKCPRLTSIDVRGNETLGEQGTKALVDFMYSHKVETHLIESPCMTLAPDHAFQWTLAVLHTASKFVD